MPEDRQPFFVPGEDSARIGEEKALGSEVAADGEEAIFGVIDRWKPQPAIELVERQRCKHSAAAGIWAGVCKVREHL